MAVSSTIATDDGLIVAAIGITDYSMAEGYEHRSLRQPINDAMQLCVILSRDWGERARLSLITDIPPRYRVPNMTMGVRDTSVPLTPARLLDEVREAGYSAWPQDVLLLYVGGHGCINGRGEICLIVPNGTKAEAVSLRTLTEAAEACPAQRRIIIFDCCQEIEAGQCPDEPARRRLRDAYLCHLQDVSQRWAVWLTCSFGENAAEDEQEDAQRSGVFMACLFESMHDVMTGDDRSVDLVSLISMTAKRVRIERDERRLALNRSGLFAASTHFHPDFSQSPLAFGPLAASGSFRLQLARQPLATRRSVRDKKRPMNAASFQRFCATWRRFLMSDWPATVPMRFWPTVIGGLLVAGILAANVLAFVPHPLSLLGWGTAGAIGGLTFLLWLLLLSLGAAANEHYFHAGGWVAAPAIILWNLTVLGVTAAFRPSPDLLFYRVSDVLWAAFLLVIFGINTFYTILSLGELTRPDERADYGHLARALKQYKQSFIVNFDNIVSVLAIAPPWYWGFLVLLGIALLCLGGQEALAIEPHTQPFGSWITLRNAMVFLFLFSQTLWFTLAFRHFLKVVTVDRPAK